MQNTVAQKLHIIKSSLATIENQVIYLYLDLSKLYDLGIPT